MSKLWDKILRRKLKPYIGPPRTYVITLNMSRFLRWCHNTGNNPKNEVIIPLYTQSGHSHQLLGYHFRSQDKIIRLEDADFGHGWNNLCQEFIIRSEGWVDPRERQKVRT